MIQSCCWWRVLRVQPKFADFFSVVLDLSISVMLPTFSFGFPKPITDSYFFQNYRSSKWLRWARCSVLAFSTQVRGFKPGRSRRIFRAKKSSARLPSEGK